MRHFQVLFQQVVDISLVPELDLVHELVELKRENVVEQNRVMPTHEDVIFPRRRGGSADLGQN